MENEKVKYVDQELPFTAAIDVPVHRFRSQFNIKDEGIEGEWNNGEVLTIPDQSMSIQEIMHRHIQGRPLPKARPMFYSGDEVLPDVSQMNEMDASDLYEQVKTAHEVAMNELDNKRKKRKAAIAANKAKRSEAEKAAVQQGVFDEKLDKPYSRYNEIRSMEGPIGPGTVGT